MRAYFLKSIFITTVSVSCFSAQAKINSDCGTIEQCYQKTLDMYLILRNQVNNATPIGEVVAYAGDENLVPDGWLFCNGQELAQAQYPDLFSVIKSIYGTPINADNFKLPDYRGVFLRGVDAGRGLDSIQNRVLSQETEKPTLYTEYIQPDNLNYDKGGFYSRGEHSTLRATAIGIDFDVSIGHSHKLGPDVHPVNMVVNYIIYAGHL